MKKYDELTARLLERRDSYVAAQAAKRKRIMQVALPMSGGLLAAVIGIALWQGGVFENTPPVTDGVEPDGITTTATTEKPTTPTTDSADDTTTTTDKDDPTDAPTDTTVDPAEDPTGEATEEPSSAVSATHTDPTKSPSVAMPSTTAPTKGTTGKKEPTTGTTDKTNPTESPSVAVPSTTAPTKGTTDKTDPTKTEKPTTSVTDGTDKTEPTKNTTTGKDKPTTKPTTKTEPTKTTSTKTDPTTQTTKIDVSDWPVITADTPQFVGSDGGSLIGNEKGYLTRNLKKKMKIHDGEDVLYAVVVEVLLYLDEYNGFWQSTEELAQFDNEYWDVYHAYEEEAKRLNPDYPHEKDTVWSDEMRENYDRWLILLDKRRVLEKQYQDAYYLNIINPRVDYLKEVTRTEMIPISEDEKYYAVYGYVGFYAELPAETLRKLEARGDYVVRLVSPEGDLVRND